MVGMLKVVNIGVLGVFLTGCVQSGIRSSATADFTSTISAPSPQHVVESEPIETVLVVTETMTPTLSPLPTSTVGPLFINVVTETDYPPFQMVDPVTGELSGLDIDLMRAVALKANLAIDFTFTQSSDILQSVSNCVYDVGIGHIVTSAVLSTNVLVSDPYFDANLVILAHHENPFIVSSDEMANKQIGINSEFRGHDATIGLIENLVDYDKNQLMIDDLRAQRIEGAILTYPTAQYYLREQVGDLVMVGDLKSDEAYVIVVCPTNEKLLAWINEGIQAAGQDQLIEMIRRKWLEDQPMHIPTEAP